MLSAKPNGLATGQNSGYQAINLAYLLGCRRVLLLGYDLQLGAGGREHWFGAHPVKTVPAHFSAFLQNFARLARELPKGFEVVNCTPGGALDCFPRALLEDELARLLPDSIAAGISA